RVQASWSSQSTGRCVHSPVAGSQWAVVQRSWSSQVTGVPLQTTPLPTIWSHLSSEVQALPSLQVSPGVGSNLHSWVAGSQESLVQGFWSSQTFPTPTHRPSALHLSSVVQALPSSQFAFGVGSCLQTPEAGSQKSRVHW